jgi:hypothetical protein
MDTVSVALGKCLPGDERRGDNHRLSLGAGDDSRWGYSLFTSAFVAHRTLEVFEKALLFRGLCGDDVFMSGNESPNRVLVHGFEHAENLTQGGG